MRAKSHKAKILYFIHVKDGGNGAEKVLLIYGFPRREAMNQNVLNYPF
jgi:hypothetical protein